MSNTGWAKRAALSWKPWNWFDRSENTGNVYDWSDLWKGLGVAGAQTMKSLSTGTMDAATGLANIVGADGVADGIRKGRRLVEKGWDEVLTPGGKETAQTFREEPLTRQTLRAVQLGAPLAMGGAAGVPGVGAVAAGQHAEVLPDVAVEQDGTVRHADPVYTAWDNATSFSPGTWLPSIVGEMRHPAAQATWQQAVSTGGLIGGVEAASRKFPQTTARFAIPAMAVLGAYNAPGFAKRVSDQFDALAGNGELYSQTMPTKDEQQ